MRKKKDVRTLFDPSKVEVCRLKAGELEFVYADVKRADDAVELVVHGETLNRDDFVKKGWFPFGGIGSVMKELQEKGFADGGLEETDPEGAKKAEAKAAKPKPKRLYKNSPYFDRSDTPVLQQSCCVFADVLGFRQMALQRSEAGTEAQLLEELFAALDRSTEEFKQSKMMVEHPPLWDYKFFTDNLVMGYPRLSRGGWEDAEAEFGRTFGLISEYQLGLAIQGFFIRGGLSFGNLHISENLAFGRALIDAYDVETKRARVPRLMLHESAVEKVRQQLRSYATVGISPHNFVLLVDVDGAVFINYLAPAICDDLVYEEGLQKHKEMVVEKLDATKAETDVYEKYVWTARYHNYFCRTFLTNAENLLIEVDDREFLPLEARFEKRRGEVIDHYADGERR